MKRYIAIIILTTGLLFSTIGWMKTFTRAQQQTKQLDALATASANLNYIEKYYRDTVEHTVYVDKLVPDNKAAKILAINKGRADSLERALKIAINKIDSYTKVAATVSDKVKLKPAHDTTKKYLSYSDKWLQLKLATDSSTLHFRYNIDLNIARYHKKNWLLGEEKHYLDLWSDDKRVTINGLQRFQVKGRPQRRFGIGLSAGYGLTAAGQITPYLGIGINYNVIEF